MSEEMIQYLVLDRRDPKRNMARYYVLALEPDLFGDTLLVREWGRIGRNGQRRVERHADAVRAAEALSVWLARKRRRGYEARR
ncbi:WGR domain-containing protein [Microvirga brassicacearum]|uniref:WGR domain-containing protein n=1 Tax=Microvirga brassicacearum TaxID=2580413 RepID=A0A5N3PC34_9HYPH|nr:WGR domain-containing protein [Microvirga brassicacearum]KAB0267254.1 WGR domain-containing protein [Microvirga brassicacearum]